MTERKTYHHQPSYTALKLYNHPCNSPHIWTIILLTTCTTPVHGDFIKDQRLSESQSQILTRFATTSDLALFPVKTWVMYSFALEIYNRCLFFLSHLRVSVRNPFWKISAALICTWNILSDSVLCVTFMSICEKWYWKISAALVCTWIYHRFLIFASYLQLSLTTLLKNNCCTHLHLKYMIRSWFFIAFTGFCDNTSHRWALNTNQG